MCKLAREVNSQHCTCQWFVATNLGLYFDEGLKIVSIYTNYLAVGLFLSFSSQEMVHRSLKFHSLYLALKPVYRDYCRHAFV